MFLRLDGKSGLDRQYDTVTTKPGFQPRSMNPTSHPQRPVISMASLPGFGHPSIHPSSTLLRSGKQASKQGALVTSLSLLLGAATPHKWNAKRLDRERGAVVFQSKLTKFWVEGVLDWWTLRV